MARLDTRPFERGDQDAVRNLILAGLGEHFGRLDLTLNPDVDDIWANYPAKGHWFLVAVKDGKVVGCGALVREAPGVGRLARVSVDAAQRRQGIARRIAVELITIGRDAGFSKIVVETNDDWQAAIRLYEGCGFHPFDHRNGEIHMVLSLSESI
jgi:ribosomal protein S18 acetylase RimI-like enzyme